MRIGSRLNRVLAPMIRQSGGAFLREDRDLTATVVYELLGSPDDCRCIPVGQHLYMLNVFEPPGKNIRRRESPVSCPVMPQADRFRERRASRRPSPGTTPRHFRACRTVPMRLLFSVPLDA